MAYKGTFGKLLVLQIKINRKLINQHSLHLAVCIFFQLQRSDANSLRLTISLYSVSFKSCNLRSLFKTCNKLTRCLPCDAIKKFQNYWLPI